MEIETVHEVRIAVNNVHQYMPMELYVNEMTRLMIIRSPEEMSAEDSLKLNATEILSSISKHFA